MTREQRDRLERLKAALADELAAFDVYSAGLLRIDVEGPALSPEMRDARRDRWESAQMNAVACANAYVRSLGVAD